MKKNSNFPVLLTVRQFKISSRKCGFTLIELIVAVSVFVILVGIAAGGFARAIRIQREVQQLLAANSNASLAIETIARDIRTGRWFCHGTEDPNALATYEDCNPQSAAWGSYNTLAFVDAIGREVAYCRTPDGVLRKNSNVVSGVLPSCSVSSDALTSSNVIVDYLYFQLMGNQSFDKYQPRITIFLGIHPNTTDPALQQSIIHLQTTISSRQPDG
ncbi:MAG: type II secretion system protein [Patescibacteria group bacterium]|nr:type II secretion system GspH family protein [Patescibacteria group bacterium]MDE2015023.1 type II secretion system protein [Patescibacteria group bacterium]MDE2226451.1 type II secretion system protein [Patescibacteria group bacterium]